MEKLIAIRDFYPDGSPVDVIIERTIAELEQGTVSDELRADIDALRARLGDCNVTRLLAQAIA